MRRLSMVGLVLAGALFAQSAAAQGAPDTADAPAHYQRALELYQEQDFAGALVEFRRAYELSPSYKMQYNIGQVCYQLTDYACALRSFEQYIREGGSSISTERRAEVDKELAKLRLRVGKLEIVSNIPGVEVSVDDIVVGTTPLPAPVVVSSGKRRITGTHAGYAPVSRMVEVAGTDSSRLELVFVNAGAPAPAAAAPEEPQYESRFNTITWIGLGVTAAFAATSAITGVVALNADHDLKDMKYADGAGPSSEMESTQDRAKTFSVLSDVALGLSVASLAGTLVYTFVHKPKRIERSTASLDFGFTGTGATLGGSF